MGELPWCQTFGLVRAAILDYWLTERSLFKKAGRTVTRAELFLFYGASMLSHDMFGGYQQHTRMCL